MYKFSAKIDIIDINPYVKVPSLIVRKLYEEMSKAAGPIPVKGKLQGKPFIANIVKFRGLQRLYLNMPMRKAANKDVGDTVKIELQLDASIRETPSPRKFTLALAKSKTAREAFEKLSPSRQKEILRYLNNLKQQETLERNISKVIHFLEGKKVEGLIVATYSGGRKTNGKK